MISSYASGCVFWHENSTDLVSFYDNRKFNFDSDVSKEVKDELYFFCCLGNGYIFSFAAWKSYTFLRINPVTLVLVSGSPAQSLSQNTLRLQFVFSISVWIFNQNAFVLSTNFTTLNISRHEPIVAPSMHFDNSLTLLLISGFEYLCDKVTYQLLNGIFV